MVDVPSPGPEWSRAVEFTPRFLRRLRAAQVLYVLTTPSMVLTVVVAVAVVVVGDAALGWTLPAGVVSVVALAVTASIAIPVLRGLRHTVASGVGPQLGDTLTVSGTREALVLEWADERREHPYWFMGRVSRRMGFVRIRQVGSDRSLLLPASAVAGDDIAELRRRITWWREHPQFRPRPTRST